MCERPVRAGVRCVVFVFALLLLLLLLVLVLAGGATGRPLEFAFEFAFGVALALVAPALELLLLPLFGGSVFAERLRLKYCVNPLVAFVVVFDYATLADVVA